MTDRKLGAKIVVICLALGATPALAEQRVDSITRQLQSQGYTNIEVKRTWLGRVRIEAYRGTLEREIVVNPRTGEILRDYWEEEGDTHQVLGQHNDEDDGDDASDTAYDDDHDDDDSGFDGDDHDGDDHDDADDDDDGDDGDDGSDDGGDDDGDDDDD
ncbi:hypothetical protein [Shimia sp. R9_3]|uniref:hypothetical protein n=1 Tax=Shimia sp. R9_3 TaxID=2821113 RepID=UPI001ADD3F42|nr:hypothetical protein [Shimia sp. R9_3]MBO9402088.1 hypothetical protein [Shimia sp. R9_3]